MLPRSRSSDKQAARAWPRPPGAADWRVLVVEDEPILATLIAETLGELGFAVHVLDHGREVADFVRAYAPDAVLLDLNLPGRDGFSICRGLREFSTVPLIMVTARAEAEDRLQGLDLGADDYICKPFSPDELAARLRALLRRATQWQQGVGAPGLSIDNQALQARFNGAPLALTPIEFRLLQTLSEQPGRVYSRAQLLDLVYHNEHEVSERAVDSHVKNLRRKIVDAAGVDPLQAVYGIGYKFQWG